MPTRVAVIGASSHRHKFGNKAFRAFLKRGYEAYAVNPHEDQVEGHRTYATVADLPEAVDIATLYVPPQIGEQLVDEIAAQKIPEVWVNPGAGSRALLERARDKGLKTRELCSILTIGESPSDY
jgi:acyl-CoA synthetase (NDP forming)